MESRSTSEPTDILTRIPLALSAEIFIFANGPVKLLLLSLVSKAHKALCESNEVWLPYFDINNPKFNKLVTTTTNLKKLFRENPDIRHPHYITIDSAGREYLTLNWLQTASGPIVPHVKQNLPLIKAGRYCLMQAVNSSNYLGNLAPIQRAAFACGYTLEQVTSIEFVTKSPKMFSAAKHKIPFGVAKKLNSLQVKYGIERKLTVDEVHCSQKYENNLIMAARELKESSITGRGLGVREFRKKCNDEVKKINDELVRIKKVRNQLRDQKPAENLPVVKCVS